MDETVKRLCAAGLVLLINVSSLSEGWEHEQAVVQDHSHQDPYEYEHGRPAIGVTLSATMASSSVYGKLEKKVAEAAEYQRYLKALEED